MEQVKEIEGKEFLDKDKEMGRIGSLCNWN